MEWHGTALHGTAWHSNARQVVAKKAMLWQCDAM